MEFPTTTEPPSKPGWYWVKVGEHPHHGSLWEHTRVRGLPGVDTDIFGNKIPLYWELLPQYNAAKCIRKFTTLRTDQVTFEYAVPFDGCEIVEEHDPMLKRTFLKMVATPTEEE